MTAINVYEIFTKLTMQNGVSSVLGAISKEVLNLEGGIGRLSKAFESLNKTSLAVGGGLAVFAGGGILYGLKKVTDQAKELSHELVQIQKLGNISPGQFEQAKTWAYSMHSQVPGATSVDALKVYGQIYSPLGHENALKIGKSLLEFSQVLGNTTGDYKGASDKVYEMVRAGDLIGKFMNSVTHKVDVGALQRFLDLGERVVLATHGKVSVDTWFQMAQQGGPALSGMTDEGLLTMGIVAQMMKGPRAGTALMSLFQQFRGGIMSQWRAQELHELGLVGKYHVQKGGHLTWDPGALDTPFVRAFSKDPAAGVQILVDAMKAHGITKQDDQVNKLYEILQRQTSIREIHDLLRNLPQIKQERERIAAGLGVSSALSLQSAQDYEYVMQKLSASWDEMMMHIASPLSEAAIPIMDKIGSEFDKIGEAAKDPANAAAIANIGNGLAILGTALIAGGAVAILLALGPAGWMAAGITVLGLVYLKYGDKINKGIHDFSDAVRNFGVGAFEKLGKCIHEFSDGVRNFGVAAFEQIIDWTKKFGKAIGDLWSWLQSLNPLRHSESFSGNWFDGGGRIIRTAYEGGGGGDFGGSVGHRAIAGGGGIGPGTAARGTLKTNQIEAYGAAIAAGLSPTAARALVANMSGESLANPANKHWDVHHFSQGIVQWDDERAAAINRHFGKFPKNMSVTEQVNAAIWEMQTKYKKTWAILQSGAGAQEMISSLVRDYEMPANKAAAIAQRIGYLRGLPEHLAGKQHSVTPYHKPERQRPIYNTMYLDGEVLHHSVVKRVVRGMTHPTTAPYHDGSRHWTPPDAGLVGV
jgi:hypothetical protein